MREIKFRGKRLHNNEWVFGSFLHDTTLDPGDKSEYLIWTEDWNGGTWHDVDQETVGQFTGLKDKNGKEIYEGDVINHNETDTDWVIVFENESASFVCYKKTDSERNKYYIPPRATLEVIGNIHEEQYKHLIK